MVNTCHSISHQKFGKFPLFFGLAQAADRTYYTNEGLRLIWNWEGLNIRG